MVYEYRSLAGYLREQSDDLILVLIGDHQPPAAVSGQGCVMARARARDWPPGRRPSPTARSRGFRSQASNRGDPSIGAMYQLTPVLLDAFDESPDAIATSTHAERQPRAPADSAAPGGRRGSAGRRR